MQKLKPAKILKQQANIHSEMHLLAEEISRYFNEPKKFGMYLGVLKKIGVRTGRRLFSETKQSNVDEPVKIFMYKIKQYNLKKNVKSGNGKK